MSKIKGKTAQPRTGAEMIMDGKIRAALAENRASFKKIESFLRNVQNPTGGLKVQDPNEGKAMRDLRKLKNLVFENTSATEKIFKIFLSRIS